MFQGNIRDAVRSYLHEKESGVDELSDMDDKIQSHEISGDDISKSSSLVKLQRAHDILMYKLRSKSRTANLWLTYIEYIDTLKLFIRA